MLARLLPRKGYPEQGRGMSIGWCLICLAALSGCVTVQQQTQTPSPGSAIAARTLLLVGRPYQYGGAGPDAFDCSGLVHFVHDELGITTPRTTTDQFAAARPIPLEQLAAGDLLFFRLDGPNISHVGIYVGSGQFAHAPQTGRPVELRALDDGFFRQHLVGAGRLHQEPRNMNRSD
jgi:murein DD-endopeptidase